MFIRSFDPLQVSLLANKRTLQGERLEKAGIQKKVTDVSAQEPGC